MPECNQIPHPREAHVGVAKVPDERLDRLAALYNPAKLTHASVEYVDVGAIGQDSLKESSYVAHLRGVDALAHVVRAFEDESIPHAGPIDPWLVEAACAVAYSKGLIATVEPEESH